MHEVTGAAYTQFDLKLSDKVQFKGGLCYEYSDSKLGNAAGELLVDRAFGALFPIFYVRSKPLVDAMGIYLCNSS